MSTLAKDVRNISRTFHELEEKPLRRRVMFSNSIKTLNHKIDGTEFSLNVEHVLNEFNRGILVFFHLVKLKIGFRGKSLTLKSISLFLCS